MTRSYSTVGEMEELRNRIRAQVGQAMQDTQQAPAPSIMQRPASTAPATQAPTEDPVAQSIVADVTRKMVDAADDRTAVENAILSKPKMTMNPTTVDNMDTLKPLNEVLGITQTDLAFSSAASMPESIMEAPVSSTSLGFDTTSDNPVEFALAQNAENTTLTQESIENQIRDALGSNVRSAAILGAFSKESGDAFDRLEEGTHYSLTAAYNVWKDADVDAVLQTLPADVRRRLQQDYRNGVRTGGAASPEDRRLLGLAMMDTKYEGGSDYRGRGLIHITHESNYRQVGERIGVDLVANPELVNDPRYAVPAALAYLEINGFFNGDQEITADTLQRMVNPGAPTSVKNSRWANTQNYLRAWQGETTPEESLVPRPRPNTQE